MTGDLLLDSDQKIDLPSLEFPEPVMSFAITPKAKGDEEKVATSLRRLSEEDPTLQLRRDPQTGEQLLSGMTQMHVEVAVDRLKRRFGVEVDLNPPRVPYLETIRKESKGHGRYKKQTGGRGQFGDCQIMLEPIEGHTGYEFDDKIVGGVIPQSFRPAVDKGIQEAMQKGELAGAPVQGCGCGSSTARTTRSTPPRWRSRSPARWPSSRPTRQADPVLLEPIMDVDVTVPDDTVGSVNGDLNSRRGSAPGDGAERRHDPHQGRGADGRDAHLRPGAHVDDRRARRLPHAVPALRRGSDPRRAEADRRVEEGEGRGEGLGEPGGGGGTGPPPRRTCGLG